LSKRVLIVVAIAVILAAAGAFALQPDSGVPEDAPTQDQMAAEIGAQVMLNIYRGHVPGRSAEIMLVPRPHNFLIGEWDLTTLGSGTPEIATSHPNPWNYLARVPIVLYGPGYVDRSGDSYAATDITSLAPTYAELLRLDDFNSESPPLPGALTQSTKKLPRVVFTIVLDGGGWNTLQAHPESHPFIDSLRRHGLTYVNATIGSAPSITGALHASFGTGAYPLGHGLPGNQMRGPDGKNTDTWRQDADPRYLRLPTVSELWDEANGNKPVVATVSYEGWHLGMIGHGAQRDTGDKDVAVLWEAADNAWWINEDFYELPPYLETTDLDRLEAYESRLDARDGIADGLWFGHRLDELQEDVVRPGTPAFVRFTGDAVIDVMRNERIGADEITDMMWVEMKMPDFAGHAWNVLSSEEEDVLRETDRQIERFVEELDRLAGSGNYVVALSADHGQQPLPDTFGGWRINNRELERDIEELFGPVVEKITPVDIYLDTDQIEEDDVDPDDIARYIATYTIGENVPENALGFGRVPDGRIDEELFAGAFTTGYLTSLTPQSIESFGTGDYPEGDLTIERG
jgi:predicted AlkP superfamily pyrophosphatase or phosphodiesterase